MDEERIRCPACNRRFNERGLRLHLRKALEGFGPVWDESMQHTKWARSKGIEVTDEGYTFEFDKLKDALDRYLRGQ